MAKPSTKRRSSKRKRATDSELLRAAESIADVVPSLRKFRRRKKLKAAERGLITRMVNRVEQAGGRANLIALKPSQVKLAKRKKLTVGRGIEAVSRGGLPSDTKLSITKKGIKIKTGSGKTERTFIYEQIVDVRTIPDRMVELLEQARAEKKNMLIYLWTQHGRGKVGVGVASAVEAEFGHLRDAGRYERFAAVRGIVYLYV